MVSYHKDHLRPVTVLLIIIVLESETFLSFDLEALFISTTSILIAPTLHPDLQKHSTSWRQKAYSLFEDMTGSGNLVAKLEQSELRQLDRMLNTLKSTGNLPEGFQASTPLSIDQLHENSHQDRSLETAAGNNINMEQPQSLGPSMYDGSFSGDLTGLGLSAAQIMSMVDAMEEDQTQWVSEALLAHTM